jgi:hypothetical protein
MARHEIQHGTTEGKAAGHRRVMDRDYYHPFARAITIFRGKSYGDLPISAIG